MWTRLMPPSLRRCGAPQRPSHFGVSSERSVRAPVTVKSSSTSIKTYYDVLGVDSSSSVDDIKSAFRRRAKLVHPDVSKSADSEEEFKQLKEAYDVLSDAEQRAEYDEALQQAQRRRSGRTAGSSGSSSRVVIIQDDPWGFGGATVEVVMEGFDSDDDDDDDDDDGFLNELDYLTWAATPGNLKSSFQSSWQANARKQKRRVRQQQQQQQRAAMQAQLSMEDKVVLMQEMPPQARAAAQQVFGSRLQGLNNLEELAEVMEAVMEMNAMGIEFEYINEGGGGRSSTRGSRRQGGRSNSRGSGSGASAGRDTNARRGGSRGGTSTGSGKRRM